VPGEDIRVGRLEHHILRAELGGETRDDVSPPFANLLGDPSDSIINMDAPASSWRLASSIACAASRAPSASSAATVLAPPAPN
jgi:hypothetical protein